MNRSSSLVLILGLLMDAGPARADWSALPPLATPRFGAAAAAAQGQLYVLGGRSSTAMPNASVWSNATQSWSESTPMPNGRFFLGAAELGGQVYALGGFGDDGLPVTDVQRFDPGSGVWRVLAPMPTARANMGVAVLNGRMLVAGGEGEGGVAAADGFSYDPATNLWSPIANLPTPRYGVTAAVLGGRLWVIGGSSGGPVPTVERYDPTSGSWSSGPDLPEGLWLAAAATLEDRIWVTGGFDASFQRSNRVYSIGSEGIWRAELTMPEPLAGSAVAALDRCLVVCGGVDASGQPSSWVFAQCLAAPPPPPPPSESLEVAVRLKPSSLNARLHRRWIRALIRAEGWSAHRIVVSSIRLAGQVVDPRAPVRRRQHHGDPVLVVRFARSAFTELPTGTHLLPLTATRDDGEPVQGVAELHVHRSHGCDEQDNDKDDSDENLDAEDKNDNDARNRGRRMRAENQGSGATGVVLALDAAEPVTIDVLDVQGRVVERIANGVVAAGEHRWQWPATGRRVPAGLYLVRLRRAGTQDVVRLSVLR